MAGRIRMRAFLFATLAIAASSLSLFGQTPGKPAWEPGPGRLTLELWPHGAPGPATNLPPEADLNTAKDPLIAGRPIIRLGNVSKPTLTVYQPKKPSGAAVVVFPGGGYHILAIDLEGTEVCDWLNSIRVACILVKYRVPDSGPYPKSVAALQDAQRAVGMVRSRAAEWHIDPARIGVLGFSAGGHLSAALSTHYEQRLYDPVDDADKVGCRPDFAVLVYPWHLALEEKNMEPDPEIKATKDTPTTFMVQAEDDPVHVENSTVYFAELKAAGVEAEMHIYAKGGHGYGLRHRDDLPVTDWPKLVERWLRTIGAMKP